MDTSRPTFGKIYESNYRSSFLFVKSYIHDARAAEDIVSESLIKLWHLLKTEPADNIKPLLFTFLKNAAIDYLRHESVKKSAIEHLGKFAVRELEIRISTLQACDPDIIFSSEVKSILEKTLNSLSQKTRDVFLKSRMDGIPYKKIASEMGITVKGVDYHINKAMDELKKALKDYIPCWLFFF